MSPNYLCDECQHMIDTVTDWKLGDPRAQDDWWRAYQPHAINEPSSPSDGDNREEQWRYIIRTWDGLDLFDSVDCGCHLCFLVLDTDKNESLTWTVDRESVQQLSAFSVKMLIYVSPDDPTSIEHLKHSAQIAWFLRENGSPFASTTLQYSFRESRGRFGLQVPQQITLSKSTTSKQCIDQIAEWLVTCSMEHKSCKAACASELRNGWLPTRLIDTKEFNTGEEILVVETSSFIDDVEYITLSHCVCPD